MFSSRVFSSKEPGPTSGSTAECPAVPELVLSLIKYPEENEKSIADLSLPWAALVLLPHLRSHTHPRVRTHTHSSIRTYCILFK